MLVQRAGFHLFSGDVTVAEDGVRPLRVTEVSSGFVAVRAHVIKLLQHRIGSGGGRLKRVHLRRIGEQGGVGRACESRPGHRRFAGQRRKMQVVAVAVSRAARLEFIL